MRFRALQLSHLAVAVLAVACTGEIGSGRDTRSGPGTVGSATGATGPGGGAPSIQITNTGPIISKPGATSRVVRMNHQQWENTVRDLFEMPMPLGLSSSFVAEPLLSAFDTNGSLLSVGADLWLDYQTAAETVATNVAHDATLLAKIVPSTTAGSAAKAKAFIETFGLRAYRRPLTDAEITHLVDLFNKGPMLIGSADPFADGVELVLGLILQSPHFLYRTELSTATVDGRIPLDHYEVATKLAYSLTNTMPDADLFTAAAAKHLQTRDDVLAQATRLLGTQGAEDTTADFHNQLMRMREYDIVHKDEKLYPTFTGAGADMKEEALTFVHDVVFEQGHGLTELLTAPYTFANSRISQFYGLKTSTPRDGQPDPFVRVELDPKQRAGLLTQVGFLASNAEQATPSIIIRGVHIAKDILCVDLPPPPDMVPPLPPLASNSTNRQRVEMLTKEAPCNSCHTNLINPLGFAFEHLDGIGQYRTQENGQPIDATAKYALDDQPADFDGAVQLIGAIAKSQQAHDCYSRHLIEYLYGRDTDASNGADENLIAQAGARSKNDWSVKNLILNLVATDAFLTRSP
jgi:Protein of unknown function (DUF1592)/Protein of unknown function (DUF1588)/Protein of unknown function (DUF1595)/Protein of unknown function (DUF1587)/Protein of unknown function (DUF1585)